MSAPDTIRFADSLSTKPFSANLFSEGWNMEKRKRILFVDDEPKILEGLRRILRPLRNEWEVEFAEGGIEALEILSRSSFDAIVTDMRMPVMNGLELLNRVKSLYPHIIRIVLSGQADQETILHTVGPIHQYLTKPSDAETLRAIVDRALSLHDILRNERIETLVTQMDSVPSLPSLYDDLILKLQSPDVSIRTIADIVTQDMGMSAKVLQLVNSAFFGVRRHISSPEQAVALLGLNIIRPLALSVHIFRRFENDSLGFLSNMGIWNHSMNVGKIAKQIAMNERQDSKFVDNAFIAGLLHDIGILVLATVIPNDYMATIKKAKEQGIPLFQAEWETLGFSHERVAGYLLGLWGFTNNIVEAVTYHHAPGESSFRGFSPLVALYVANIMENKLSGEPVISRTAELDTAYLSERGFGEKVEKWKEIAERCILKEDEDE